MSYIFISGIPASGKSYLAKKLSLELGVFHFDTDTLRKEMAKDPKLEPWVNFYWNKDEKEYYTNTSCDQLWKNLVNQSEAFWSTILNKINEIKQSHPVAIFEGVNILPHLAAKDLDFPGVYLLGESQEQILERIKKAPRWGATEELQEIEASIFFNCERIHYQKEAEKYGFMTFTNPKEAESGIRKLLDR
jgi:2-phosphoglycerate kinase